MSRLIPTYIEQALRIELLERAVIASEGDVKRLEHKLAKTVATERERCARVCEERGSFNSMYAHHILTGAAEAIRKGEKDSLTTVERKPVPEFELIEKWEGE